MADDTIATGYLRLIPSVDGIQSAIAGPFTAGGKDAAKRFGGSFTPALGGLLAAAGGLLLAREVKQFVGAGVEALKKWETINAQTSAVIKSTGGVANVSAAQINDLAQAIEATTATEAESIQEGANLLLTFKNIRNEAGAGNDVFDQTVRSLVDVSRAMGTDASGSAIQLGKALNDPIKGIAALARVGITFSEDQKAMIKSLVESGDLLGAQKIILEELNSQFGGSGESYAKTLAGQTYLLSDAYGDLQERVAEGVMPAIGSFVGFAIQALARLNASPSLDSFIAKVNSSSGALVSTAGLVLDIITNLNASPEGFTLGGFIDQLAAAAPAMVPFLDVITELAPILPAFADAVAKIGPSLVEALPGLSDLLLEVLPLIPVLAPPLIDLLTALADFVVLAGPGITEFAGFLGEVVTNSVGLYTLVGDVLTGLSDAQIVAEAATGKYGELQGAIIGWAHEWDESVTAIYEGIVAGFANGNVQIDGFVKDAGQAALDFRQSTIDAFTNGAKQIGQFVSTAVTALSSWVTDRANDVIRFVNAILVPVNAIRTAIQDMTGISLPNLYVPALPVSGRAARGFPGAAEGGTIARAGWTWVGEAGPELLNLNVGAQVRPLDNLGPAVAGFPETITLVDSDGSLLGRMRVLIEDRGDAETATRLAGWRPDFQ